MSDFASALPAALPEKDAIPGERNIERLVGAIREAASQYDITEKVERRDYWWARFNALLAQVVRVAAQHNAAALDVASLTRQECQRIIREVKQIETRSRDDIRDRMAAHVRAILSDVVKERAAFLRAVSEETT